MRSVVRCVAAMALVAACSLAGAPAAGALENESFGVTPFPERASGSDRQSFSIPLETGATFEDAVRIYNLTDEIVNLAIYATDAKKALDDTTVTVGVREEEAAGVGTWIDLSRKSVELEPRDAKTITFRVKVGSSDPKPDLGAIVVENRDRGLAASSVQRLYILVRTVPPNTQTSSKRVRTFLVQSPWVAIALLGLVVAGAVVWVGARRARRPRDLVVQPGELDADDAAQAPRASRPVITRLGASADHAPHARSSVLERVRATAGARRRDDRPLLDDALLVEIDAEGAAVRDEHVTERHASGAEGAERASAARAPREREPVRASAARKPAARSVAKPRTAARSTTASKPKTTAQRASAARSGSKAKPRSGGKPKTAVSSKAKPKPKRTSTDKDTQNFIPLKDL